MPYKTSAIIIAAFAGHAAADGHADGHADDLVDLFPHKVRPIYLCHHEPGFMTPMSPLPTSTQTLSNCPPPRASPK